MKYLIEGGITPYDKIDRAVGVLAARLEEWANDDRDKFDFTKMRALSKGEVAEARR